MHSPKLFKNGHIYASIHWFPTGRAHPLVGSYDDRKKKKKKEAKGKALRLLVIGTHRVN